MDRSAEFKASEVYWIPPSVQPQRKVYYNSGSKKELCSKGYFHSVCSGKHLPECTCYIATNLWAKAKRLAVWCLAGG